jgi:hypothetical protein
MSVPVWKGRIAGGALRIDDDRFGAWIRILPEGDYEIIIRRPRRFRSDQQNRYIWGVVYALISERLGWSAEDVHDHCRVLFLSQEGRTGPSRPGSTRDLSTTEFSEYCKRIQRWAAEGFPDPDTGQAWPELSVYVPDPNEVVK